MNGGRLLYKCRLCGEIVDNIHVPDVSLAVVLLEVRGNLYDMDWGGTATTTTTHRCKNGDIGIADLIGGREDPP